MRDSHGTTKRFENSGDRWSSGKAVLRISARSSKRTQRWAIDDSLAELERLSRSGRVSLWVFAHVYAVLGPPEKALSFLEQAYAQHETILVFMKIEPMMRSLHSSPRFQAILKQIGLSA